MKTLSLRTAAIGLCTLAASVAVVKAAGNYQNYPIVGQPSTCISVVSGAGGFNPDGNVGGGGATGQGQAPSGSLCAQLLPAGPPFLTGAEIVPVDTGQQTPASATVPLPLLGNFSGTPRNYVDNGSLNVQQRGTAITTCGTTTVPSSAYGPDRFGCYANVTSGAGRTQIVTTAALLPTGFASVNNVYRTSGALTQPVCSIQEVPTAKATALQGKTVTISFFSTALAGLSADNGNLMTASIFTGTGSDQGLQTLTASPAITPAWTGIASPVNQQVIPITITPTRYSVTGIIPTNATEVAVALCFTPTATGAGTTDGFAYTGVQLEVAPSASPYEFHDIAQDTVVAQRYAYALPEGASGVAQFNANVISATVCEAVYQFPVQMRVAPTLSQIGTAITSGTTYKANSSTAGLTNISAMATKVANTVNAASINWTSAAMTAGQACTVEGLAGGAISLWSADF